MYRNNDFFNSQTEWLNVGKDVQIGQFFPAWPTRWGQKLNNSAKGWICPYDVLFLCYIWECISSLVKPSNVAVKVVEENDVLM